MDVMTIMVLVVVLGGVCAISWVFRTDIAYVWRASVAYVRFWQYWDRIKGDLMARKYRKAQPDKMDAAMDKHGVDIIQEPKESVKHDIGAFEVGPYFHKAQLALADLHYWMRQNGKPMDAGKVAAMIARIEGMVEEYEGRKSEIITE